jgi:hypothetical protein
LRRKPSSLLGRRELRTRLPAARIDQRSAWHGRLPDPVLSDNALPLVECDSERDDVDQARAIERVLDTYNRARDSAYSVTGHPDQANRDSKEIDAVADSAGLPQMAIEHTRIQSLSDQQGRSASFERALAGLETNLAGVFPFQLDLVVPYQNVEPGRSWTEIRRAINEWLVAGAGELPDGATSHSLSGVPFRLTVRKRPGQPGKVFLMREAPAGLEASLLPEMRRSLDHKYLRLGEYRAQGATTILILDSEDIALVAPSDLYLAFLRATREQPRPHLDQVWLVLQFGAYCFSGPADLMAKVNPENFHFGAPYVHEWLPEPAAAIPSG